MLPPGSRQVLVLFLFIFLFETLSGLLLFLFTPLLPFFFPPLSPPPLLRSPLPPSLPPPLLPSPLSPSFPPSPFPPGLTPLPSSSPLLSPFLPQLKYELPENAKYVCLEFPTESGAQVTSVGLIRQSTANAALHPFLNTLTLGGTWRPSGLRSHAAGETPQQCPFMGLLFLLSGVVTTLDNLLI